MKETIINVKGMMCGGCENRIKNALGDLKDIEKVEANYKTGKVKIFTSENVERKAMEDVIEDIGFEVVKEN